MDSVPVTMRVEEVRQLACELLMAHGLGADQAGAVAEVIAAGERDACHSHGVYRIPAASARSHRASSSPVQSPVIRDDPGPIVRVDAGFGLAVLRLRWARPVLAERARRFGLAALVINNCFRFSALWPEVEALASDGLVALAMTPITAGWLPLEAPSRFSARTRSPLPGRGRARTLMCSILRPVKPRGARLN